MENWIKNLGIKVIKTMAETSSALLGTAMFINDVEWLTVLSATILSGIMTILLNLKEIGE